MINRKYLEPFINREFPDIKKTRFQLNGQPLRYFTENTLLPFLIYQNTTDSKSRLIQLYLQENSASTHFLPFYVALGFYRKAIDSVFNSQDFKTLKYRVGTKKVTLNGSVCSITDVNFISKSITLHHGTGSVTEILIDEDFRLKWNYPESYDLREKLSKFDKLLGLSDQNLFSLPIPKDDKNHEGIIVFTHISKFQTLLRNLEVSGSSLNDYIGVHRTVFDTDTEQILFRALSGAKTKGRQPTVLASALSDIFAYDQILIAGNGQYNHLKTVIIEDFDLELRSWERNGTLSENLEAMDKIYFSKLGKSIKDIYLVCGNRNFDLHTILKRHHIDPMTWMLTAEEASELDEYGDIRQVLVKEFFEAKLIKILGKLETHILLWKSMSIQYFCAGQTLEIVGRLYGIRDKLNSFYSPNTFFKIVQEVKESIVNLQNKWFTSGQDYGLINQTLEIFECINSISENPSEQLSVQIRSSMNEIHEILTIVTNNKDKEDHEYLQSLIAVNWVSIRFLSIKDLLEKKVEHNPQCEKLIYLVWNKEIVNNLLTNFSLPEQLFLINRKGYHFIKNYSRSAWISISSVSSTKEKYELLNIKPDQNDQGRYDFPNNINFTDQAVDVLEEDQEIIPIPELEETVMNIASEISAKNTFRYKDGSSVNVFFEDGSYLSYPENRSIFYYDEESTDRFSSPHKEAKNLEKNDLIIVPKNRIEIKKLLNETLSRIEGFSSYISSDQEWRTKLGNFIIKSNGDVSRFRENLKLNGIKVEADVTIRNWLEGETLEPRNFSNLLSVLAKMHILEMEKTRVYLGGTQKLKGMKTNFLRIAMQKLIYNLKGIDFKSDEELFHADLLNSFLDHVEMKKVLIVIGGNYAD